MSAFSPSFSHWPYPPKKPPIQLCSWSPCGLFAIDYDNGRIKMNIAKVIEKKIWLIFPLDHRQTSRTSARTSGIDYMFEITSVR
jgi:hypothetical protein